jgi:methylenetetrahydrofolate dehydrogenase (NADP+) / methenyltetrahydrofolate cyclohydrolase
VKESAVILNAGYNEGNIGDVDYDSCYKKAGVITPVPGGVGPVTISMLLEQTVDSAEKSAKLL